MESRMDMINGSLGDKIIKYALPLAVTGVLQQLFNAADLAVVGQFSGKEAMAAVGGNAPVIGLLVNLAANLSQMTHKASMSLRVRQRHIRRQRAGKIIRTVSRTAPRLRRNISTTA